MEKKIDLTPEVFDKYQQNGDISCWEDGDILPILEEGTLPPLGQGQHFKITASIRDEKAGRFFLRLSSYNYGESLPKPAYGKVRVVGLLLREKEIPAAPKPVREYPVDGKGNILDGEEIL